MNEISRGDRARVRRRWADGIGVIGRADLNGTGVSERFITGASTPVGIAVSSRYIYWANNATGTIGRANLDGTGVNQRIVTVQAGRPLGVTLIPGS
jgi:hypothetical protein